LGSLGSHERDKLNKPGERFFEFQKVGQFQANREMNVGG
jgi:hypothetical protein